MYSKIYLLAAELSLTPCLVSKIKIPKKISGKSRRNKKRIATAACKSRDESNEPN